MDKTRVKDLINAGDLQGAERALNDLMGTGAYVSPRIYNILAALKAVRSTSEHLEGALKRAGYNLEHDLLKEVEAIGK